LASPAPPHRPRAVRRAPVSRWATCAAWRSIRSPPQHLRALMLLP